MATITEIIKNIVRKTMEENYSTVEKELAAYCNCTPKECLWCVPEKLRGKLLPKKRADWLASEIARDL